MLEMYDHFFFYFHIKSVVKIRVNVKATHVEAASSAERKVGK